MSHSSLAGKHILVTRAKEQAKVLSQAIRNTGGIPIEVPLLAFQPSKQQDSLQKKVDCIQQYDWLVFTSANGVRFFMEVFNQEGATQQKLPRIAVVGTKTANVLRKYGLNAEVFPNEFVAESLAKELKHYAKKGERILIVRGNLGREILAHELEQFGLIVSDVIVYETVLPNSAYESMSQLLQSQTQLDVVTFTSSSTVSHFVKLIDELGIRHQLNTTAVACIGPITAKTAQELGLNVDIIPNSYTVEGLVEAIGSYIEEGNTQ
ncbi:uroporphyrinogen-III synthase [Halalkalibacter urbisdiaboli]|uniref:uroporphyrinogen-III synthase n=1 Tax=Halalkalibacter urbisdiaboli TaxID=1960589 RepID=UPI000B44996E|nr:uroporphyrinogen-III synthase [Halalkalibacter urbisdiaboli]